MARYSFGKPEPPAPYTGAGEIGKTDIVLSLKTRMKVVVHIPPERAKVGDETGPDFEPGLRKAVAEAMIGAESAGFVVTYVAVEQFEDAGG